MELLGTIVIVVGLHGEGNIYYIQVDQIGDGER